MLSPAFASVLGATWLSVLATAASIPNTTPELHLKRDSTPTPCEFPLGRDDEYGYWDHSDAAGRPVCFGWDTGEIHCGKPWSEEEINDIVSATSQQLTKDGQFKTSTVGRWTASFGLLTTAFKDPNPMFFEDSIKNVQTEGDEDAKSSIGAMSYFYQDSGNFIRVDATKCP